MDCADADATNCLASPSTIALTTRAFFVVLLGEVNRLAPKRRRDEAWKCR